MAKFDTMCAGVMLLFICTVAHANCERYEFAELKAMQAEDLKLKYCLNAIEIERQAQQISKASKMSDLELQNPLGTSQRELDKNSNISSAAEEKLERCRGENGRIFSAINGKKVNKVALLKECP